MKFIGLLGAGTVARYGHLPAIVATPGLQLASIYEPNPAGHESLRQQYPGTKMFTEVEAFFASGIDAVAITSPAPAHLQNVLDAVRHGKPILCEKPLAMDDAQTRTMMAVAAGKVPLFTAFCYRFAPAALLIKQWVDEKAIGKLCALRLIYNWNCHGRFAKLADGTVVLQRRRADRMLEGGPMVDCGTHQIDLARFWTGSEVVRQHAHGIWVEDFAAPDHMVLHMDHACGAHTMVEISYSYTATAKEPLSNFTYELLGSDGLIRFHRESNTFELRNTKGTQRRECGHEKNFEAMYQHFGTFLETGNPGALPSAQDGFIATHIARTATDQAMAERLQKG